MHVLLAVSGVVHVHVLARARRLTLLYLHVGAPWKLALLLVIGFSVRLTQRVRPSRVTTDTAFSFAL